MDVKSNIVKDETLSDDLVAVQRNNKKMYRLLEKFSYVFLYFS